MADPYQAKPYILDRDTAPAFWLVATLWMPMATGLQTANRFSMIEQWMPTGLGPPTHRHPFANEGFYVLEGTVAYNAEGETLLAGPGTFVHIPRLLPHSFSVTTSDAHVLNFYAPAGFELCILSAAKLADERRRPTMEESAPPNPAEIELVSKLFGQEKVEALPFAQPSSPPIMATKPGVWSIGDFKVAHSRDVSPTKLFGMDWYCLGGGKDTDGTYDILEVQMPGQCSMPERIVGQDEALYVLEGALHVELNGDSSVAKVGSFVYVPAGSRLRWSTDTTARCLCFHIPGGFDELLARSDGDLTRLGQLFEASGTTLQLR